MAFQLSLDVVDPDGSIKVTHVFWGLTEVEARDYADEHELSDAYFKAAVTDGRVIEELEEIPDGELPEAEEDEEETEEEESEES